jgi:acetyltransferase-like isoleucine patch superfamily enzyme
MGIKIVIKKISHRIFEKFYPNLRLLRDDNLELNLLKSNSDGTLIGQLTKLYTPYHVSNSKIGAFTYIASNSYISLTTIGKFCSIGPNLLCGWGIHPTKGISTSPMFYSILKQNGMSLSKENKIEERKPIKIGNDVFIGANVTILDGVSIGDGAVIGAGAVVSKDIPPYAIAVGIPIIIRSYRFSDETIEKLLKIQWWNFEEENLVEVEEHFFEVDKFIGKFYNNF